MIRVAKDPQVIVVAGMEWLADVYRREPAPEPGRGQ